MLTPVLGQIPPEEREALIAFYNAANGPGWVDRARENWLGPPGTEGDWRGVTVENDHVVRLDLDGGHRIQGIIPPEFGALTHLRSLSFVQHCPLGTCSPASIESLPEEFGLLQSLEYLDLWGDKLTKLPESFGRLSSLVNLNLRGNQLTSLPESFAQLSALRTLNLSGNPIAAFPPAFGQLRLRGLRLRGFSVLPEAIGQITTLEELDLGGVEMERLPEFVGDLSNLRELNLSRSTITTLSPAVGRLRSLQKLFLDETPIEELPPEITTLPYLAQIFARDSDLMRLPEDLGKLTSLRTLDLEGSQLEHLPDSIGQLVNLSKLELEGNQLEALPDSFGLLSKIVRMDLTDNQLRQLPEDLSGMTSLEWLVVRENQLTSLPGSLVELPNLIWILAEHNQISEFPIELAASTSLGWLELDHNLISEIPARLADSPSLGALDLAYNDLAELPVELASLSTLQELNVDANHISELPESFIESSNLRNLSARDNQLTTVPEGLCSRIGWTGIWLSRNRIEGPIPNCLSEAIKDPDFLDLPQFFSGRLELAGNRFSGEMPPEFGNRLWAIDFRWNALVVRDPELRAELVRIDSELLNTQTVAPADIQIGRVNGNAVELTWTPIRFSDFGGGYEVFVSTVVGGPMTSLGRTRDKMADSFVASGLSPSTTYFFAIRTISEPHPDNPNQVISELSSLVAATTAPFVSTFFPALSVDNGFVGVAVSNPTDEIARLQFRAFDETGSELSSRLGEITLGPGEQFARLSKEVFEEAPGQTGWIEVLSDRSRLGWMFQIGGLDRLDGGLSSSFPLQKSFYFSRAAPSTFRGFDARLHVTVVNPTLETIEVQLVLTTDRHIAPIGFRTYAASRSLPPGASLRETVAELFGSLSFRDGYIRVSVTEGEGAIGFFSAELESPGTLVGLQPLTPAAGPFFSAQLVSGGGLFTSLKLINVSGRIRNATISALAENGSLLAPARTVRLVPAQTSFQGIDIGSFLGLGPDLVVGSLRLDTDGNGLLGDVLFGSSGMEYAAALPLQRQPFTHAVFSQIASTPEFYTGVAVFNPNDQPATVELEAFADTGISLGRATIALPAGARFSKLLRELLQTSGFSSGYVVLKSDVPVIAQQLFGDFDQTFLSAVPPTVLGMWDR